MYLLHVDLSQVFVQLHNNHPLLFFQNSRKYSAHLACSWYTAISVSESLYFIFLQTIYPTQIQPLREK